ncbi:MAG: DUF4124 domain-containing protein [Burkholderiales bacterium]|nr:DUF4124 domain-containing protein [Pseudomonadota bacterium]MCC7069149.1 DUF4124 domain-containing protein [Burkholderiales bacterium]
MKRLSLCLACLPLMLVGTLALGQTAYRCDQGGQTTYSDKPCPAGTAVTPTQDSAEQQARAKESNAQMRRDDAALNQRLSEREKLAAQERASMRKAGQAGAGQKDASTAKRTNAKAAKPPKAPKAPKASKAAGKRGGKGGARSGAAGDPVSKPAN